MAEILLYRPGSKVKVGPENDPIDAVIDKSAVNRAGTRIYEVQWWAGKELKSAWMLSCEFITAYPEPEFMKIGFENVSKRYDREAGTDD